VYEVDNVGRATWVCTLYLVGGVLMCDGGLHVDDPALLAKFSEAGLYGVVVAVLLKAGKFASDNGLFEVGRLSEGE